MIQIEKVTRKNGKVEYYPVKKFLFFTIYFEITDSLLVSYYTCFNRLGATHFDSLEKCREAVKKLEREIEYEKNRIEDEKIIRSEIIN